MAYTKPKGVSLDSPKERLLRMRDEELARAIRRGQLPRIEAIDAVLAALDDARPQSGNLPTALWSPMIARPSG